MTIPNFSCVQKQQCRISRASKNDDTESHLCFKKHQYRRYRCSSPTFKHKDTNIILRRLSSVFGLWGLWVLDLQFFFRQLITLFRKARKKSQTSSYYFLQTLFVEFQLHQVLDVDQKNGLWYTKAAFYISYFSDSVVWDPAEYNNISQLKFTQSEIWTSDLGKNY